MLDKKKHAVCLPVRCSAVFSLKQCVLLPDADSVASTSSLEKIYVWQKKLCSLLAHPMQCGFHSEAVRSAVWCCSSRKCKKIVTEAKKSNAVHFLIVLWFIYTRCEVHSTFSSLKKLRLNKRNHAVLLPVWCSAVFRPMQCGFQSDEVPTSIWVSRKTECPHFGKFEIPLKP